MSKKKFNKKQILRNYQPKRETEILIGEVFKGKIVEFLTTYPEHVIECVRTNEGYQQISGCSIQLPIKGNMYGISALETGKHWEKVATDFAYYMTRKFAIRLFCVPILNALFVSTEAPIEEVENFCLAIMDMNGLVVGS